MSIVWSAGNLVWIVFRPEWDVLFGGEGTSLIPRRDASLDDFGLDGRKLKEVCAG